MACRLRPFRLPFLPLPRPRSESRLPVAPPRGGRLTDEDRRNMCLYHEENKTAKQTDIGGKAIYP